MGQLALREKLLADLHSEDDASVVAAAKGLLEIGEYGTPDGTYLLAGGQAALRLRRLADAVVLLYHGLRVAQAGTLTWAEIVVNRAAACSRHGYYQDAIAAGELFLAAVAVLPMHARAWLPHVHHAMGLAYDRLQQYDKAVPHHQMAAETYPDPVRRTQSTCDLAYALALSGDVLAADRVLSCARVADDPNSQFVYQATTTLVRYHQGHYADAIAAGEQAESLAVGHEDAWALPLAEFRYWLSHAVWAAGDRHRAAALGLSAAVLANERWHLALRDASNDWLAEMMAKGGTRTAYVSPADSADFRHERDRLDS